ncbi:MAG: dipeptide/oligopeptide/nickel ABC transporter ATP-binding protein [bacterium]
MIRLKNITKRFKDNCGGNICPIDNVSFSIDRGKFFGLMGKSGAGKTTIGKIILGLYTPDKGEVWIDGEDITKFSDNQRHKYRKEIGLAMVFQHPDTSLNPGMTVRKSIEEIIRCNLKRGVSFKEIEGYFDEVNLSREKLDLYPDKLSGGEKRRVALIQTLAIKPKILIADELFSGVDSMVRNAMANLLKRMQQEEGLTLILISHDRDMVEYLCEDNYLELEGSCR